MQTHETVFTFGDKIRVRIDEKKITPILESWDHSFVRSLKNWKIVRDVTQDSVTKKLRHQVHHHSSPTT